MKLSALVLVKNEQDTIEAALAQLVFADEIVVLDQESVDQTVKLAQKYTHKIFTSKIADFAQNRNLLAARAQGDWLLYIDADERISKQTVQEIKAAITRDDKNAYYFPRKNIILGKWLRHGGWWPDYVPRLIKKEKLIGWQGAVHESPRIEGELGYLQTPINHHTARNLSQMLTKSISWAKIEAQLYYQAKNPRVTIFKLLKFSFSQFFARYFIKLGFLDGQVGLISSLYQALHHAMIFTYLWELQNDVEGKLRKFAEK